MFRGWRYGWPAIPGWRILPADLDRRYANENLPDHADLLANLIRWAAGRIPLEVRGASMIDCHLYRQLGRVILHLVNLTNAGAWRAPVEELIPVGPLQVRVQLPPEVRGHHGESLVATGKVPVKPKFLKHILRLLFSPLSRSLHAYRRHVATLQNQYFAI